MFSHGVFGRHRCFELEDAAEVDRWWAADEHLKVLTVRIPEQYEDEVLDVPLWFPKLQDSGKLQIAVEEHHAIWLGNFNGGL